MQQFIDSILVSSASGMRPLGNAQVTVYVGGTTNLAVIYSDNGSTQKENPFFSGVDGDISFYAADGRYDIRIAHPSHPTSWVRDVLLADYLDDTLLRASDMAQVAFSGLYSDLIGAPPPVVQTNADWNASSGPAEILNKPVLGSAAAADADDFATAAQGSLADTAVQPGDLGALAVKDTVSVSDISATGVPSTATYLRGDGTWETPPGGGGGGGIPEAPINGESYARKDEGWQQLHAVAVSGAYGDLSGRPTIPPAPVNADWDATSGLAQIFNKPVLGTAAAADVGDFATASQGSQGETAYGWGNHASAGYAPTESPTFTGTATLPATVMGDAALTGAMFTDCGFTYYNSGSTSSLDYANGSHQRWAPSGSATLSITNWPPSGNLGELLIEGINLGAATITWPTIQWVLSDGTTSTNFANTDVTLQTSGTDWILLWTRDAGTTVYGKVMR